MEEEEEKKFKILIVDDDIYSLENIQLSLETIPQYKTDTATGFSEAIEKFNEENFDLLITDLKFKYKDGLELAEYALNNKLVHDTVLITGYGDENSIERALKLGFRDFIRKPYKEKELLNSVQKIYETHILRLENEELKKKLKLENKILREQILKEEDEYQIIGKSSKLKTVLQRATQIAKFSENVLIQGESGTGKELLAKFIHRKGSRSKKPFISVNAASLSSSLFESELFGYRKGAFTGATESRPGLFELADGGILFLDEISEISLSLQAKLLRVIETGEVRRVGDTQWRKIDIQLIATTNKPFEALTNGKHLRQDLFHRLNSSSLSLPPLREREEDIPLLLKHYFKKYNDKYGKSVPLPKGELLNKIMEFDWPGNIRQLINFVKNYILFENAVSMQEIEHWLANGYLLGNEDEFIFKFIHGTMEEIEAAKLWLAQKILKKYNYNKSQAAKHLGMSYPGFYALIKKHNLM